MARVWLPPSVKFHDFLNAMAGATACIQPGIDGVVVEMPCALSWPTLLWVYLLFLVRLGGWETGRPEAWSEVMLVAIPKKTDKVGFRAMRYISLLLVLQKIYVRALQTAVRRKRKPHSTNILVFCASEIHCRSHGGVETSAQQGGTKGCWRFRGLCRRRGAIDGIRHRDVTEALLQKGMHP